MSADDTAMLVRRYFDDCVQRVNGPERQRALATLDELLTDDFLMVYNGDDAAKADRGRQRHKAFLVSHARAYPDDGWTVASLIADDDSAACVWRIRARHARTGNAIDVTAADFYRVRGGRLAELRRFLDFAGLERQQRSPPG